MDELRLGYVKNNPWVICDRAAAATQRISMRHHHHRPVDLKVAPQTSSPSRSKFNKVPYNTDDDVIVRPKSLDNDEAYANFMMISSNFQQNVSTFQQNVGKFQLQQSGGGDLIYGPGFVQKLRNRYLQLLIDLSNHHHQSNLRLNSSLDLQQNQRSIVSINNNSSATRSCNTSISNIINNFDLLVDQQQEDKDHSNTTKMCGNKRKKLATDHHHNNNNNNTRNLFNESNNSTTSRVYARRSASCDELTISLNNRLLAATETAAIIDKFLPNSIDFSSAKKNNNCGKIKENVKSSEKFPLISGTKCDDDDQVVSKERMEKISLINNAVDYVDIISDNVDAVNDSVVISDNVGIADNMTDKKSKSSKFTENNVPEFVKVAKSLKPVIFQQQQDRPKNEILEKEKRLQQKLSSNFIIDPNNSDNTTVASDDAQTILLDQSKVDTEESRDLTGNKALSPKADDNNGAINSNCTNHVTNIHASHTDNVISADSELLQLLKRFNQRRKQRAVDDGDKKSNSSSSAIFSSVKHRTALSPPPDREKGEFVNENLHIPDDHEPTGGKVSVEYAFDVSSSSSSNVGDDSTDKVISLSDNESSRHRLAIRQSLSKKFRSKRRSSNEASSDTEDNKNLLEANETSISDLTKSTLLGSPAKKTEFFTVASYNPSKNSKNGSDSSSNTHRKDSSLNYLASYSNKGDDNKENENKIFLARCQFVNDNVKLEKSSLFSGCRKIKATLSFVQDYPLVYAYIDEEEADNWSPGVQLDFVGYKELCLRLKKEKISQLRANIEEESLGNFRYFKPSQLKNLHNNAQQHHHEREEAIIDLYDDSTASIRLKTNTSTTATIIESECILKNSENIINSSTSDLNMEKWSRETNEDLLF